MISRPYTLWLCVARAVLLHGIGARAMCNLGSLRYLLKHPAFRAQPLRVAGRCVRWEFLRLRALDITVRVHGDCVMKLIPPARGRGHDGVVYCFGEFYEPGVRAALLADLKPGSVAYDIGANIGLWTLLMSRLVSPTGSVTAFEPVPRTAARLRANLSLSRADSTRVEEVALGRTSGTVRVFVPTHCDRASLAPESEGDAVLDVPLMRLDDYWVQTGMPMVSFVKIDAEGSEPRILAGADQLIGECRPTVACEVNSAKLAPLGHRAGEVFEFFARHGYEAYVWVDSRRAFRPSHEMTEGDVLFRPRADRMAWSAPQNGCTPS